jgi:hypothetical protein
MRVVDRATFLSLPAGTVYAKWYPLVMGDLHIKGDTTSNARDWLHQPLADSLEGDEPVVSLMSLDEGKEVAVDLDCLSRDGMFDADQRFAVWGPLDVHKLILRLQDAIAAAHPKWVKDLGEAMCEEFMKRANLIREQIAEDERQIILGSERLPSLDGVQNHGSVIDPKAAP